MTTNQPTEQTETKTETERESLLTFPNLFVLFVAFIFFSYLVGMVITERYEYKRGLPLEQEFGKNHIIETEKKLGNDRWSERRYLITVPSKTNPLGKRYWVITTKDGTIKYKEKIEHSQLSSILASIREVESSTMLGD